MGSYISRSWSCSCTNAYSIYRKRFMSRKFWNICQKFNLNWYLISTTQKNTCHWRRSGVLIVIFEQVSYNVLVLVFLWLTLNKKMMVKVFQIAFTGRKSGSPSVKLNRVVWIWEGVTLIIQTFFKAKIWSKNPGSWVPTLISAAVARLFEIIRSLNPVIGSLFCRISWISSRVL